MNFERIIGKIEAELIAKATAKLSGAFLELALRPDNIHVGQGLGGDPLLFALLQPMQHVATLNIPTAATDGKRYYWNPKFIMKLSPIGLRLVCGHEAWHAIYMHPQRRGERIPKLWNICVDFIVNNLLMEDISFRKLDPKNTFVQHLGHYLDVDQYTEMLKNPFEPIKGFDKYFLDASNQAPNLTLPKADDERELTDEEKKEIERLGKRVTLFYADPIIPDNLKKPENLYDYFYKLLPKCPECGKPGMYKVPKENKGPTPPAKKSEDLEDSEEESETSNSEENHEEHNHAEEQKPSHEGQDALDQPGTQKGKGKGKGCSTCGPGAHGEGSGGADGDGEGEGDQYVDIFDFGGTLDDHMDAEESPEKMGQRLADAIETAKRMAGHIPAGLQDELGKLTAPIVKWKDVIRSQLTKSHDGNTRNDWTRFRSRPLFAGLLTPKRVDHLCSFVVLLDCSGSMSVADISFGVSQLQGLDTRAEGIVVPADCTIYWDKITKLKNVSQEELSKINVVGRGGTMFAAFFQDYEKKVGKANFLIMITDGYLLDQDIAEMKDPGIPVYWLITSTSSFVPPFGRAFYLRQ
jgi:predicted metal-dependent peptidase